MSDDLGTETGNDIVTPDVADDDPEKEALRARIKELESHIGRQNDLHGRRLREIKQEFSSQIESLRAEIDRLQREREEAEIKARMQAMTPAERAMYEANKVRSELEQLKAQQALAIKQEQEVRVIQEILREAKEAGIDPSEIDTESAETAVISLEAARRRKLETEVKELKELLKKQQEQLKDEVVETVRAVSGSRRVPPAGSPSAPEDKLPKEVRELVDRYETAIRRRDRIEIYKVLAEANRLGVQLQYRPG